MIVIANQIILAGTNFDTIAASGADVKSFLDLSKFTWERDVWHIVVLTRAMFQNRPLFSASRRRNIVA